MLVNTAILLICANIPMVNDSSCCWMYSMNTDEPRAHLPILRIALASYPASLNAHAPPDRFECMSILLMGMPLFG